MMTQGMMQQEQSSPHQQGSLTPGVARLRPFWTPEDGDDECDDAYA